MPNPRKTLDFNQIEPDYTTFRADGVTIIPDMTQPNGAAAAQIGKAVTPQANGGYVQLCADAQVVLGVLLQVEADGFCTVHTGDYIRLPSNPAPVVGNRIVGALGPAAARGYIRAAAAPGAAYAQAVAIDVLNARGIVVDAADANNVYVFTD